MRMNHDIELRAYLKRQLEKGNYVEVAAPELRSADAWVLISDQHSREKSQERDLNEITPRSRFVISALKPSTGLIAALAVPPQQESFSEAESAPAEQAPPQEIARRVTSSLEEMRKTDHRVIELLNSDAASTYEKLVEAAGSTDSLNASLRRIRRFKTRGLNVQTIDTVVQIDPERLLKKSVPSLKSAQASVVYLGKEKASRGEVKISLEIHLNEDEQVDLLNANGTRQGVRLDTMNNLRSLKLLQASQLLDLRVNVVVLQHFDLSTRKWMFAVSEILEEPSLIQQMGVIGNFINEQY